MHIVLVGLEFALDEMSCLTPLAETQRGFTRIADWKMEMVERTLRTLSTA